MSLCGVGGGVCKVIFKSNPTIVLGLGWGLVGVLTIKLHGVVVELGFR